MKSFLLVLVGVILGAVLTFVAASGVLIGAGAGAGIVTGLKAGACLTAEAAKSKGYITADKVDELLTEAAKQVANQKLADASAFTGSDAACQKVIEDVRNAAQKAE